MTELVFNTFDKYGVVGVFFFLGLTVIVNLKNIIPFLDGYKKRRMNLLKEVSTDKEVDELIKSHIQDEIDTEYFKIAHGIKIEKSKALCIIKTHKELDNRVPFKSFINAHSMIGIEKGKIKITIRKVDKLSHYYNNFTFFALFSFSPVIAALATVTENELEKLIYTSFSIICMVLSIVILATTRSYVSAKLIKKELNLAELKEEDLL